MEADELEILPLNQEEVKRPEWLHPALPGHPACVSIFAPVRSGKTLTIVNMILRFYRNPKTKTSLWDRIIYISASCERDMTVQPLRELPFIEFHTEYCDELIDEIVQEAEDHRDEDGNPTTAINKPRILIVADDIAVDIKRTSAISKFSQRYRHINASLWFTAQTYKSLSNLIRANTSHWFLFGTENEGEKAKLESEHNGIPGFMSMYLDCTREPYSFMNIDVQQQKVRKRFQKAIVWESKR